MLSWQALEKWLILLEEPLKPLEKSFELIFVFLTKQLLGKEGWLYTASCKKNLLVVPRQTMSAYLPVIHDRLAVNDLRLVQAVDEE